MHCDPIPEQFHTHFQSCSQCQSCQDLCDEGYELLYSKELNESRKHWAELLDHYENHDTDDHSRCAED